MHSAFCPNLFRSKDISIRQRFGAINAG